MSSEIYDLAAKFYERWFPYPKNNEQVWNEIIALIKETIKSTQEELG